MVDSDTVVRAGDAWSGLSTGWKWSIAFMLLAVLGGAFGVGYWLGSDNTAAKYEREIGSLEREMAGLQKAKENKIVEYELVAVYPGDDLPDLADAPADRRTMMEYAEQLSKHRGEYKGKTAIQTPDFHAMSEGRKFTWQGIVNDVSVFTRENSEPTAITVRMWTNYNRDTKAEIYSTSCCFDAEKHGEALRTLETGDLITAEGVMGPGGDLFKCNLLAVEPHG